MRKAILVIIALTTGCIKLEVPVPPSWNECEASEQDYIDMAFDTQDQPPTIEPGTTPQQVHDDALEWIDSMGYDLVIGNPTNYQGLAGKGKDFCAITLPGHIFISEKCSAEMGSNHVLWSALLRHEGTHAAQQKRMGASFFLVYAYGEGRLLGIETPAYDVTYSTLRYFALDETLGVIAPTTEVLVEKAGSFYDKYDGTHIPKQCYQDIAVRVWSDQ